MKRSVIILFLILSLPCLVIAKEITINELFDVKEEESHEKVSYFYNGQELISNYNSSDLNYVYLDRMGSSFESKSLPFGEPINLENRFSFTGKELDNELYYFGARYYDPSLGRFISVDPLKGNHPYSYVNNNPLNLIDPDGKEMVERDEHMRRDWGNTPLVNIMEEASRHAQVYRRDRGGSNGRYIDTFYGLVDLDHLRASSAGRVIEDVTAAYVSGMLNGEMAPFEVRMGAQDELTFVMDVKLSDLLLEQDPLSEGQILEIAFGVYSALSWAFESAQNDEFKSSFSSFAPEDMRSNYLSFFIAANDLDSNQVLWALGGKSKRTSLFGSNIFYEAWKGKMQGDVKMWPDNMPVWVTSNMPQMNFDNWEVVSKRKTFPSRN